MPAPSVVAHGGGESGFSTPRRINSPAAVPSENVTRNFLYNARGDRIQETTPGGETATLVYDQADRLIQYGTNASYAYNGNGLRVSKTVNGVTTHFVWNQAQAMSELLQDGSTYYIYGPDGQPIEQIAAEKPTYLHQDQQGSVRLLTDSSGNVVGRYDYDSWGNVMSHAGTSITNLQYDGQYTDAETGFQYLRARYYDPVTGQFVTQDPAFPVTWERYGYAANEPLDLNDPTGLSIGDPLGIITGAYDVVKSVTDTVVVTPIGCVTGHCRAALKQDVKDYQQNGIDFLEGLTKLPTLILPNIPGLTSPNGPVAMLNTPYDYGAVKLAGYVFQPDCGSWPVFST